MAIHFCFMCQNEWDCKNNNCDGTIREKLCRRHENIVHKYWRPQDL